MADFIPFGLAKTNKPVTLMEKRFGLLHDNATPEWRATSSLSDLVSRDFSQHFLNKSVG